MPTETEEKTPETALAERSAERPAKVPVLMGVAPKSVEEAWRLAGFLAASELVPKHFRNRQADILVAIQHAMEIGLPPLQGLQSIAVINGRATLWGDGFLAVIMGCPLYLNHEEYFEVGGARCDGLTLEDLTLNDTAAVCTFWRRGKPQPVSRRFTIGQARKAGLLDKKETPWQTYPDRMLAMRARGFAGRDAFPDVLRGIRTAEEVLDQPTESVIELPAAAVPVEPRRASANARPATDPPAAEPPAPRGPSSTTERGLLVTQTNVVHPAQGESYFKITLQTGTGAERIVVTRDEAIFREAHSFAGTDHAVVITTHDAPRADLNGERVLVLDALAIDDSVTTAATLFER
jgi:hypothetical protein